MLPRWSLALFVVLIAACGSDDTSPPRGGDKEITSSIGTSGGVIELAGAAKLTITANAFTGTTVGTLRQSTDPEVQNTFQESAVLFGDLDGDSTEITVSFDRSVTVRGTVTLAIVPSDAFLQRLTAGGSVVALALISDVSTDEESSESHSYFEGVPSTFDAGARLVTVTLTPGILRSVASDRWEVTIKLAVARPTAGSMLAQPLAVAARPLAVTSGRPSFADPLVDPIVIAAFRQPRPSGPHGGTDFRAQTPLPVYSMAAGHIKMVKVQACNCENLTPQCDAGNPNFAVTVRHNNGSTVVFRHLKRGSIANFVGDERCWIQPATGEIKYPVAAGQAIAQTGSTGTDTPHLHVEYSSGADPNSPANRQNIFRAYGSLNFVDDYAVFDLTEHPKVRVVVGKASGPSTPVLHKRSAAAGGLLPVTARGSGFANGNEYFSVDLSNKITSDESIETERFDKIQYGSGGVSHDNSEIRLVPKKPLILPKIVVDALDPSTFTKIDSIEIPVRVLFNGTADFQVVGLSQEIGTPIKRQIPCPGGEVGPCFADMYCVAPVRYVSR